jgi:4-amino-4-deoxy-L-arabinose transferase-like glycosyltransferase
MKPGGAGRALLLLVISLLIFVPFVGRREIVTSHEARVVQVAREMAYSGWPWNTTRLEVPRTELVRIAGVETLRPRADGSTMSVNPWIVPVMNGQVRLQKPPLPYWCTAVMFRLFGESTTAARILPALMGAFAILLIWDLARMLLGRVGAWYAALIWISSYFVVDEFRKVMADPYLAFFTLLAIWSWVRAVHVQQSQLLLVFYAALALGVLAKGPIIFIFLVVTLTAYHVCYRRGLPGRWTLHAIGALLVVLVAAPWYLAVAASIDNAWELWRYESVGALSDKVEGARPWYYYPPQLLQLALPWTVIWFFGLAYPLRHLRRGRLFALVSSVLIVVTFSLAHDKKNAYLLPMMPLQTLVIAQGFCWITSSLRIVWRRLRPRVVQHVVTALALGLAVVLQVFLSKFHADAENLRSPRYACQQVLRILHDSPRTTLLVSRVPVEASVYLPLHLRESSDSDEVLAIVPNRGNDAWDVSRQINVTASGPVVNTEPVPVPQAPNQQWKVFRLCLHQSSVPDQARDRSSMNTWQSSLRD